MKQLLSILGLLAFISTSLFAQKPKIPYSKTVEHQDNYWDTTINDPYRWLENLKDPSVEKWVNSQNSNTNTHLRKSDKGENILDRLISKSRNVRQKTVTRKSKYYFYQAFYDERNTAALYYSTNPSRNYAMLLDPLKLEGDGLREITNYEPSKNDKYLAFQYNINGSDWLYGGVVVLKKKQLLVDRLEGLRFTNMIWDGDEGFYYGRSVTKDQFSPVEQQAIYYHKVGTTQDKDKLVYKRKETKGLSLDLDMTFDERYIILKEDHPTRGYSYFYIDLESDIRMFRPLALKTKHEIYFYDTMDSGEFLVSVKINGNNGIIAKIDPKNPKVIAPLSEPYQDAMLTNVIKLKDKIIGVYQSFQSTVLITYSFEGEKLFSLPFGVGYSLSNFIYKEQENTVYFYMSSYVMPAILYKLNPDTYTFEKIETLNMGYDYRNYVIRSETFYSKDSTEVPLLIIHKKGTKRDGTNPTLLQAYGGFGIISKPYFDPGIVYFLDKGGVFAFASIRGGGDNGDIWAKMGRGEYKQNCFDDFIGAAEHLIEKKYTNSKKLAITGGSHGGLVVGVAMTQRPDLFAIAIPKVGVYDMLRFEKFTVGNLHVDEFGTVADSTGFYNLLSYSPLHNIKPYINYPTTLIMTSDNDERVPPFHSYKFAAALQNRFAQQNPIYLRVEKNAGHQGALTYRAAIQEIEDFYGFLFHHLLVKKDE